MENIITSGQLCCFKKKNILMGVHNILATIEFINQKNLKGALLSFDMEKAFDRCYIPYICKVLQKMNFSDHFIDQIKDMHHNTTTRFILNSLTCPLEVTFSIRQGDPISMLLYIIYMEPFLLCLKRRLSGIQMGGFVQIDEDYADDVEVMVESDDDIVLANEIFKKFEACSGAKLSRSKKSKIFGLGTWHDRTNWPLQWIRTENELKVFGIFIKKNFAETLEKNWPELINKFRGTIISYQMRSLETLHQRAEVLKIYGCS